MSYRIKTHEELIKSGWVASAHQEVYTLSTETRRLAIDWHDLASAEGLSGYLIGDDVVFVNDDKFKVSRLVVPVEACVKLGYEPTDVLAKPFSRQIYVSNHFSTGLMS